MVHRVWHYSDEVHLSTAHPYSFVGTQVQDGGRVDGRINIYSVLMLRDCE